MVLLLSSWIFIQTPFGQNWIAKKVTDRFSKDLKTKINISKVSFSLFNKMNLEGVLVEDRQKDTLLFAGNVQVKITDWFFWKDKAELKYIGLSDAYIKLQRSDSVWNYKFIEDYFSPSGTSAKKGGIEFDLKKAELKNVLFIKKDPWLGEDMVIKLKQFNLDADEINFTKKNIAANSITIIEPLFSIRNYTKNKQTTPEVSITTTSVDSLLKWNRESWVFNINEVNIVNGIFKTDKQSDLPALASFDGKHIEFSKINARFKNIKWDKDTIIAQTAITARERSGLVIKKLNADLVLHPQAMEFNNLLLQTNNSTLKDRFVMRYKKMSDLGDFIHLVKLESNFTESEIDSDDLAFFAPALGTWKKNITLAGKIRGTIDELKAENLIVQAGKNTLLNGDITLSGLPHINETFIDFIAKDFKTTYSDAVTLVPQIRKITKPDLAKIQYLNFKGSFTGFIKDFVTFGTIQTNLGNITSDLNMKLPAGGEPVYSGNIATANFRLGTFLSDPSIGGISFDGKVNGTSFKWNKINAEIKGQIKQVDYNNYNYKNIAVDGSLDKQMFLGTGSINDANAEATLIGKIDLREKIPVFNATADVSKLNLRALKLSQDNLSFKGKLNLDFEGGNIDNFLGSAKITEATLQKDSVPLSFKNLTLTSTKANGVKVLTAESDELNGNITGDFSVKDMPAAISFLLNKYYPAYIKAPSRQPKNQSFDFDFTTGAVDEYVKLINKDLSGFDNSHFKGKLDLFSNTIKVDADIPQFAFNKTNISGIKITAEGDAERLLLSGNVENAQIGDSMQLPGSTFKIESKNDISKVEINTSSNRVFNDAKLSGVVQTYYDGVGIKFDPSTFVLNGKTFTIEKDGELTFRSNTVAQGELVLTESNQRIQLSTEPTEDGGNWNDLKVRLTNVNIGDFSNYFLKGFRLEGLVDGVIKIEDPNNRFNVRTEDLKARQVWFDKDSVGNIEGSMGYVNKTGQLTGDFVNLDPEHKLKLGLSLNLKDKEKRKEDRLTFIVDNYFANYLEKFIGTLFTDVRGFVTGKLDMVGTGKNVQYIGKVKTRDAGMKVIFTQCYYKIADDEIELKPNSIDFGNMVIIDTVTKNPIYLSGSIEHSSFRDMLFDMRITTQKPGTTNTANNKPVLLLNTTTKDNTSFYGTAKGTGFLTLYGPQSDMFMKIDAKASETDSSFITIMSSDSRVGDNAGFMVERKYGTLQSDSGLLASSSNITYDVDLNATSLVNMRVVLDELTRDEILGSGKGDINIRAGTTEPLSMRGRYLIEKGSYKFSFKSFFNRPFELIGNDNYIQWNGDPYKADTHIDAKYTAEKVSFAPLKSNLGSNYSNVVDDVGVIATLTGDLFKPNIKFGLQFNPQFANRPDFDLSIRQIEKDQNELNKQVTYLIVFNSFTTVESNSLSTQTLGGFGINTISGIFAGKINEKLNEILGKLIKNPTVKVNFNSSFYNSNPLDPTNNTGLNLTSAVNLSIGKSFFQDRFVLTFGGNADIPLTSVNTSSSVQLLPDVTAEWLINKSGSVRATFFFRQNVDLLSSGGARVSKGGSSISYRKDFNTLGDLFKPRKIKEPAGPKNDTIRASSQLF